MTQKSDPMDLEIGEMLAFYQAAAARSDSHVATRAPSEHSSISRPSDIDRRISVRHPASTSRREQLR